MTQNGLQNTKIAKYGYIEFEVNVKTLGRLVSNHGVKHIDFLKTDIEGSDTKIFYGYDFRVRPKVIKMECLHQEQFDNVDINDFKDYMKSKEYTLYCEDDFEPNDLWFFDKQVI